VPCDNFRLPSRTREWTIVVAACALAGAILIAAAALMDYWVQLRDSPRILSGFLPKDLRGSEEDRAKILELKAEGRSIRQIAAAMKCPRATIARALARRAAAAALEGQRR